MTEQLIHSYGYLAILIGTFLEGETILFVGGFVASNGYLTLSGVMLAAFIGSLAGDQCVFLLGRRFGTAFLLRRPRWQARLARALVLIERYHEWLILTFRFMYGIRSVISLALGASRVSARRFAVLNVVGAAIWAVAVGAMGYGLGNLFDLMAAHPEWLAVWAIPAVLALSMLFLWLRRRRRARRVPMAIIELSLPAPVPPCRVPLGSGLVHSLVPSSVAAQPPPRAPVAEN